MGWEPGEQLSGRTPSVYSVSSATTVDPVNGNYTGVLPIRLCRGIIKLTGALRPQDAATIPL